MTSRTARRLVATAVVLLLVAGAPDRASAETAPVTEVAWWSQRIGAMAQPDGGFELAFQVNAESSVAAVRITVPAGGASRVQLVLAATTELPEDVAFSGCALREPWGPANPGAWADQPVDDCETSDPVSFGRSTGGQWVADVTRLAPQAGGELSVLIHPGALPVADGAPILTAYTATFSAASVMLDGTSSTGGGGGGGGGNGGGTPTTVFTPVIPRIPFTPAPPLTFTPTTASNEQALPLPDPGASGSQGTVPVFDIAGGKDRGQLWGRLVWLLPLCALGGFASGVGRKVVREGPLLRRPVTPSDAGPGANP